MRARSIGLVLCVLCSASTVRAQVRVHPTGVNVNVQSATTVFLTYGGLAGYVPAESFWCGELMPATPAIGLQCDPATLFGSLPARYDLSRSSGTGGFTDIMSIPPSVARRAYQAAAAGAASDFFYVRRFQSVSGGPDQYVAVTCRLTGGGARVPFALTNVDVRFDVQTPVLFVRPGTTPPRLTAEIAFNGTGTLRGRWEVVLPGEAPPEDFDLITEGTLPAELRGTQRRFTEIERFNVFLPPTGRFTLAGPDPSRLPATIEGGYMILLRVEATDDKEGDTDLGSVGAGSGVLHTGAVAGFPMPVLRYFVGAGSSELTAALSRLEVRLTAPLDETEAPPDEPIRFSWEPDPRAALYRLEVQSSPGTTLAEALLPAGTTAYVAPVWLAERADARPVRWRIHVIDATGSSVARSDWRALRWRTGG